jgi:hypothetical protein
MNMIRPLIKLKPYVIKPCEIRLLTKQGYAILDSQNVYIKMYDFSTSKVYLTAAIISAILKELFLSETI